MKQEWFTAQELAGMKLTDFPKDKSAIHVKAYREEWEWRYSHESKPKNGGRRRKQYHRDSLPVYVLRRIDELRRKL